MQRKVGRESATDTIKIEITDFGPIHHGTIEIKPMTVLTGPNNSGKSYAAMLIRSMFGSNHGWRSSMRKRFDRPTAPEQTLDGSMPVQRKVVNSMVTAFCNRFQENVLDNIKSAFLDEPSSLVRIGAKRSTIMTQTGRMTAKIVISSKRPTCKVSPTQKPNVRFTIDRGSDLGYSISDNSIIVRAPTKDSRFVESIVSISLRKYFELGTAFYFPAARSGILQGHRVISASIVKHAPYVGLEEVEIPRLSGVVADFIVDIMEMPRRQGSFYEIALELEEEMLGGQIKMEHGNPTPDIKYVYKQHEIPLHRASSTVSEMAPFILYLKHMVSKGSTLIIEEPEAHLNPHNQAILAKYLVRLIRRGLRIVMTTHSPFMLEQISNMIQAGNIVSARPAGARSNSRSGVANGGNGLLADFKLREDEYLIKDQVAAYTFEVSHAGYSIRRLDVEDEGIPAEEFVDASDKIYQQSIAIQDRVANGH